MSDTDYRVQDSHISELSGYLAQVSGENVHLDSGADIHFYRKLADTVCKKINILLVSGVLEANIEYGKYEEYLDGPGALPTTDIEEIIVHIRGVLEVAISNIKTKTISPQLSLSMSTQNLITCPNCGHAFSLSDVQKHELEEMREKMKAEVEADMKKKAFGWAQEEIKKAKLEAEEASKKQSIELEDLRKRDEESRKKEMEFLKQSQEFENMKRNQSLELERAKMEERKKVEEESRKQAEERAKFEGEKMKLEYEKRMAEMQKQLEMTQRAVEDANRKANQGSMQIQGEIQEDALKEILETNFPMDIISDVEKGIKGADIIQEVRNMNGTAGVIAWESKNTKAWSDGWVEKLKEDRLRVNADVSILVTAVMPKEVEKFGLYKGVWLVEWSYVLPIAMMLRGQIESMAHLRTSLVSKDEKMEVLYHYLTSPKFKDKVENIIDAFRQMQDQVAEERRAFESRWKKREALLEQVIKNTSGMYGDLGGVLGGKLAQVEYLELGDGL